MSDTPYNEMLGKLADAIGAKRCFEFTIHAKIGEPVVVTKHEYMIDKEIITAFGDEFATFIRTAKKTTTVDVYSPDGE